MENSRAKGQLCVRSRRGTVLVEGTVATTLIIGMLVPLLIFGINLSFQLIYQAQVSHIANEAARVVDDGRYWLGLPRPDFDEQDKQKCIQQAQAAAVAMCTRLGLQGASATIKIEEDGDVDVTTCQLNCNVLARIPFRLTLFGFDMAALFPGNVTARGVSAHARVQPYAIMHLDCPVPPNNNPNGLVFRAGEGPPLNRGVAVLPAYGFWHSVPPDHGVTGWYGRMGGLKGTADITNPAQFCSMNLGGFTTRNDLLRVLKLRADGTVPPAMPPGPGDYISTAYLHPDSYINRR